MGRIATTPLVAKAELAQSYMHQARMILRRRAGSSPTLAAAVVRSSLLLRRLNDIVPGEKGSQDN